MKKWSVIFLLILVLAGLVYYFYPETKLQPDIKIDELVVIKSKRTMYAYSNGKLIKVYHVALGQDPIGDKEFRGDKRTPEGRYRINDRNPKSGFHKNLGVSYPDKTDIEEAKKRGVNPGGDIKIHGLKNGFGFIGKFHRLLNWTAGCIAVTDNEVDELYESVDNGTTIIIRP
jgi:murein L,D-transpeptidase YafK